MAAAGGGQPQAVHCGLPRLQLHFQLLQLLVGLPRHARLRLEYTRNVACEKHGAWHLRPTRQKHTNGLLKRSGLTPPAGTSIRNAVPQDYRVFGMPAVSADRFRRRTCWAVPEGLHCRGCCTLDPCQLASPGSELHVGLGRGGDRATGTVHPSGQPPRKARTWAARCPPSGQLLMPRADG